MRARARGLVNKRLTRDREERENGHVMKNQVVGRIRPKCRDAFTDDAILWNSAA